MMDVEQAVPPGDMSADAPLDTPLDAPLSRPQTGQEKANREFEDDEDQTYEEWSKSHQDPEVPIDDGQTQGFSEEDTKILLEKEFDDFYEDRIHKSAGPVVFLSKCLGMLPLIWTEDDEGAECKSYFNMYTFLVFFGWIGLAVLSGYRIAMLPETPVPNFDNSTTDPRFFGRLTVDVYTGTMFANCLVVVIFGAFKSRNFAEVLFNTAEIDSQLQLKEKHYDKLKNKSLFWIVVELLLVIAHAVPLVFFMDKCGLDVILYCCLVIASFAVAVLDLQYIHMCMALCKRYRMLNKIISHIIKPFKTFRTSEPSNQMLQRILQYRWDSMAKQEARNTFDQIWEPSEKDAASLDIKDSGINNKVDLTEDICPALLLKGGEKEISREEETTVILQLDILRGIHSDLHNVGQEINGLLGFQVLVTLCCNCILLMMIGFLLLATSFDGVFFWPLLVMLITPLLRIQILGHWAQVMKDTSMKPFWTMSQMSTLDGSPKLERQVQKFQLQASQKTARFTASGYFFVTRQTITKIYGLVLLLVFLLWKLDRLENIYSKNLTSMAQAPTSP